MNKFLHGFLLTLCFLWSMTIVDAQSCTLSCKLTVSISLDPNCSAIVVPEDLITSANNCGPLSVALFTQSGQPLPNSPMISGSQIGMTIEAVVTDLNSGNNCTVAIDVLDKFVPAPICGAFTYSCAATDRSPNSENILSDNTERIIINDCLEIDFNQPVTNMPLVDLNVGVDIFATTGADVVISLIAPDATEIILIDGNNGFDLCDNQYLNIQLDDQSEATYTDLTMGCTAGDTLTGFFNPAEALSAFNDKPSGGMWRLKICNSGAGEVYYQSAQLQFGLTQTIFPLPLPAGALINPIDASTFSVNNFDACGPAILRFQDVFTNENCGSPFNETITRNWTVEDIYGNMRTCSQTFSFERLSPGEVDLPVDLVPEDSNALSCEERAPDPGNTTLPNIGWNVLPNGHPSPDPEYYPVPNDDIVKWSGTGRPIVGGCYDLDFIYSDTRIDQCSGTNLNACFKVLRTWTAIDPCDGSTFIHEQRIVVEDGAGPTISGITDVTISTSGYSCTTDWAATIPQLTDNCSDESGLSYLLVSNVGGATYNSVNNQYTLENLPTGIHEITYQATDCCGNRTNKSMMLTVVDQISPSAVCETFRTVNLGSNGTAKLFASAFDDGSNDDCGPVFFKVIRMDNTAGILEGTTAAQDQNSCNLANGDDDDNRSGLQVYFDDEVHFCCEDIDANTLVIFRVFDVNPGTGPIAPERMEAGGDLFGHFNDCMPQVDVVDKLPPRITCPVDITLNCNQWHQDTSLTGVPFAVDNCELLDITFSDNEQLNQCQVGTVVRTWTATDIRGLSSSCKQTITMVDNTVPIIEYPSDRTIDCSDLDNLTVAGQPIVDDNCALIGWNYSDEIFPLNGGCKLKVIRTWSGMDLCDWIAYTDVQIIIAEDNEPPVLSALPDDLTVSCDAIPVVPSVTATDDCNNFSNIIFEENITNQQCLHTYVLERKWTAIDVCGNQVTDSYFITIADNVAPVFDSIPVNMNLECFDMAPLVQLTATDNCDIDPAIIFTESTVPGDCPNRFTLIRNWIARDACGNEAMVTQELNFSDDEDPVLTNIPADITLNCGDQIPAAATIVVTDNCDNLTAQLVETPGPDMCTTGLVLTRTWTATDGCGNSATDSQQIFLFDTDPPVFDSLPGDLTISCDDDLPDNKLTATDACTDDVIVSFTPAITFLDCPQELILTWTWIAEDDCGNEATHSITITRLDEIAPVISGVPVDENVSCDQVPGPATVTVSDNCDLNPSLVFDEQTIAGNCAQEMQIIRTWTAEDACGNMTTETQNIFVTDDVAPIFMNAPIDVTVECDAVPDANNVTILDNCDPAPNLTFAEVRTNGVCLDSYVLERTWTATDACGNVDEIAQTITVEDNTAPVIANGPAMLTVSCDDVPAPVNPTAVDNCDQSVTISFNEIRIDSTCIDLYRLQRTWTATDNCGNSDQFVQNVIVQDISDPVIIGVPSDVTVECNMIPLAPILSATDNCDTDVFVGFSESIIDGDCPDEYTLIRTWTATDNCGNVAIGVQMVEVQSTVLPTLTGVPADITVNCDAVPVPANPTGLGACSPNVTLTFTEVRTDGNCPFNYILRRTWAVRDDCDNRFRLSQFITVQDTEAPVMTGLPIDVTVSCSTIPDPANPVATDNCDPAVVITFSESTQPGGCAGEGGITRTWIATDACGNEMMHVQQIDFEDSEPPVFTNIPADITLNCDEIDNTVAPEATDNCTDNLVIKLVEDRVDVCPGTYTITKTWSASDNCGNVGMAEQVVSVVDDIAPVFNMQPPNLTVSCDNIPVVPTLSLTDNCDLNPVIGFNEVIGPGDCTDDYVIGRTWTGTDHCNNVSQIFQFITVKDTIPPSFDLMPLDITVTCSNDPAIAQVTNSASDNCDDDVAVTFVDNIQDSSCINQFTIQRIFIATDNCGNEVMDTVFIRVNDTIAPTFPSIDLEITVSCDAVPDASEVQASDNCLGPVTLEFSEVTLDSFCVGTKTVFRTWLATDACGNMASVSQTLNIFDDTPPVLSDVVPVINLDCNDPITDIPFVTATDNCGNTGPVNFFQDVFDEECPNTYKIRRQWIVTDFCSNSSDQNQILIITDSDAPQFDSAIPDRTVNCDEIPDGTEILFSDNCDPEPKLTISDVRIDGTCDFEFVLNRTITIRDTCGNENMASQVLTVIDTEAPTFTCPNDITMSITNQIDPPGGELVCSLFVEVPLPTFMDNCDASPLITNDYDAADSNIGSAAGMYPIGMTTVTYTIEDDCGNSNTCTVNITILDEVAPAIFCLGLDEFLDPFTLTATTFLEEMVPFAEDCQQVTRFFLPDSTQSISWGCEDVGSTFLVQVLAIDASGNDVGCFGTITIFPPNPNNCPLVLSSGSGEILTETNQAVDAVQVYVDGANQPATLTNEFGQFAMNDLTTGEDFTFLPRSNLNIRQNISTLDLVKLGRQITGLETLDSPYKLIAADVDYSNTIDIFDMVELQKLLIWDIDEFQNGNAWRFVNKDYEFPDDTNPFVEKFEETNFQEALSGPTSGIDFVAVKLGDLNADFGLEAEALPKSDWDWEIPAFEIQPNQPTLIPVYGSVLHQVEGLQFGWAYDSKQVTVQSIVAGQIDPIINTRDDQVLGSVILNGQKTLTDSSPLFTMVVEVKEQTNSTELFRIAEDKLPAYVVADGAIANSISLNYEQLPVASVQRDKELPILFSNRPNPFRDETTLRFLLPEKGEAVVQIVDVAGRALYRQDLYLEAGYHEMVLLRDQLDADGVLICQLITTKGTVSQKLLLLTR